jgi:hypothetical protein
MIWPANGAPSGVVYVTVHDADVPLADSVHSAAPMKWPGPLLVKMIVPIGAAAGPSEMSLTVAVQWL